MEMVGMLNAPGIGRHVAIFLTNLVAKLG
jgi:hypothetical protein